MANLRNEITEAIGIKCPDSIPHIEYRLLDSAKESGYTRQKSCNSYQSSAQWGTAFGKERSLRFNRKSLASFRP